MSDLPILYSLQHCPYAIRARYALFKAQQPVLIRAIKLNNKPAEMLLASPKGSVPVLVVNNDLIIEESLQIMLWAIQQSDPAQLFPVRRHEQDIVTLINQFEQQFVPAMEAYCCAKRYHETNLDACRVRCEVTLQQLEQRLSQHQYLYGEQETILDIALFPFLRKFARVERQWYLHSPYPKLRAWLNTYLQSPIFTKVMAKHELWLTRKATIYFADERAMLR